MKSNWLYLLLLVITLNLIPFNKIYAATDGNLGADSTGTSTISVTVPFNVQITSVDDINLGNWLSTSGNLDGESEVCIYSNDSSGYTVTAQSGNGSGSFVMQRTSDSATVTYTVQWFTTTGVTYNSGGGTLLTENTASPIFATGFDSSSATCAGSGGVNSTFAVQALSSDLGAVSADDNPFSDVLTLFIAPT